MRAFACRQAAARLLSAGAASGAASGAARQGEGWPASRAAQSGGPVASVPAGRGHTALSPLLSTRLLSSAGSSSCERGAAAASGEAQHGAAAAHAAARSANRGGPATCSGSSAPELQPAAQAREAWSRAWRGQPDGRARARSGRRVIAVGLSGGVDSAVATMLLKQQGCACCLPVQIQAAACRNHGDVCRSLSVRRC